MQTVATDTIAPEADPEQQIDKQRAAAFDAEYHWYRPDGTEYPLRTFNDGRDALFWQLVEADGGIDWDGARTQKDDAGNVIRQGNSMLLLGAAMKMLYICSHDPQHWADLRRDRHAFLRAIEAWASSHVPLHRHGQAVSLTIQIINDATINQAIPRPSDHTLNPKN